MALIEVNHNPSRRDYLVFGVILALLVGCVGAWLRLHAGFMLAGTLVWVVGGSVLMLFTVLPPVRRPLYLGWIYLFFPIGWLLSHVVMGIIFYLVVTPIGLLKRTFGEDSMRRNLDAEAASYWVDREGPVDPARYFRQF